MAEGGIAAALAHVARRDSWTDPLPRHDGRRQDAQQPAHGAAPRPGGAGPGPRARALGRGLRPDARRAHPPATVRRPHPPAPRPRRRPDRPRDDPHAPGPVGRGRRRGPHGVHDHAPHDRATTASTGAFGYWRTDGRPVVFPAKAVVLATGGIGRAYQVTSNSWEYSGDGHALAYLAGAELIDMEFVQFHPTGMVWPPGVRGLLVTEAVRGEGGILRNKDGERFMWRLPAGGPPPRVRRDRRGGEPLGRGAHRRPADRRAAAARAVDPRQRRARHLHRGRARAAGTPHGGVFLDISYLPADRVRRKLPSMYDQFKELADVDITAGPDGGRADDALHDGRRPRGRRDRARRRAPGLFAAGEVAGGHARRQPAGRQLAVGPARVRAACRRWRPPRSRRPLPTPHVSPTSDRESAPSWSAPLAARGRARTRIGSTRSSRRRCRRWSASSGPRTTSRGHRADRRAASALARRCAPTGTASYNPGWDLVFELRNMLIVVRGDRPGRAAADGEPGRPQPARLPGTDAEWEKVNVRRPRATATAMRVTTVARRAASPTTCADARRDSEEAGPCRDRGDAAGLPWRRRARGGSSRTRGAGRGGHGRPRRAPLDPGEPRAGPRGPLELQGRQVRLVQRRGQRPPRLMCKTRLSDFAEGEPSRSSRCGRSRSSGTS